MDPGGPIGGRLGDEHVSIHTQKKMDGVRRRVLSLAAEVERALQRSVQAVETRDVELASEVIEHDAEIDQMEIELEETVLHVLALEQPVAMDLRFLVAVLKMNNDLERIADIAANIAQQASLLAEKPWVDVMPYLAGMSEEVLGMLSEALDCLLDLDVDKADHVISWDDRVDEMHARTFGLVEADMMASPDKLSQLIHVLSISRNLERAADLATNIAEDVIYLARGEIQRHKTDAVRSRELRRSSSR